MSSENGLNFFSRRRPKSESIDSEVMDKCMVFVVNISENTLIDTNLWIHYICKNLLNKYSVFKPIDDSVEETEAQNEEVIDTQKEIQFNDSPENGNSEEVIDDKNPLIIVFDGFEAFNLKEFSKQVSNVHQLKEVILFRGLDATELLCSLYNQLPIHLALNPNLKLVVIYVNSCIIYPKIVENLNKLLFSLVISVRIVLVIDRISKNQSIEYLDNSLFEILSIKCLEFNQLEIRSNRREGTVVRDIAIPLFASNIS